MALGWVLAHRGFLSAEALRNVNRLSYWIGLPALLLVRIAGAPADVAAVSGLLVVTLGATLAGMAAGYLMTRVTGVGGGAAGTLVQGAFRGNLAFVGLPVVVYAFPGGQAQTSALLVFGPLVVFYNVAAVLVLLAGRDAAQGGVLRSALLGLVTNPILLACLGGLALTAADVSVPTFAARTLEALGQMALPLALLGIGGTLSTSKLAGSAGPVIAGALVKVGLVPAVGLALGLWLGLSAEHLRIALILLACPTAAASYILVRQLGGDAALASGIIVASSLAAMPVMVLVLYFTG